VFDEVRQDKITPAAELIEQVKGRGGIVQLNLFQWDSIEVGQGYQDLARFAFAEARAHFSRALVISPGNVAARRGLEETGFWEQSLHEAEGKAPEAALIFLWERSTLFPFVDSGHHRDLRKSLLRHLLSIVVQMSDSDRWYQLPDLCRGYLHLQLGDNAAAERYLRILLDDLPEKGRLRRYLGDSLWRQGREDVARAAYAAALLLAPYDIEVETIPIPRLETILIEHGPALAPVYGYFAGIFPLVELPCPPVSIEAQACEWLRQAELARSLGQHPSMVAARRALKDTAPEILAEYLAWLASL
jgi:tetratricopeptide (TPR) repeat protein